MTDGYFLLILLILFVLSRLFLGNILFYNCCIVLSILLFVFFFLFMFNVIIFMKKISYFLYFYLFLVCHYFLFDLSLFVTHSHLRWWWDVCLSSPRQFGLGKPVTLSRHRSYLDPCHPQCLDLTFCMVLSCQDFPFSFLL